MKRSPDIAALHNARFVVVDEPPRRAPLPMDLVEQLRQTSRPVLFLCRDGGLAFNYEPVFGPMSLTMAARSSEQEHDLWPSLPQTVGRVDVDEPREKRLDRVPVRTSPPLVELFLSRFAREFPDHGVNSADDVVQDLGFVGSALGEHGQHREGNHLVSEQPPVQLIEVIGVGAHRLLRWLILFIRAVFGRGVE